MFLLILVVAIVGFVLLQSARKEIRDTADRISALERKIAALQGQPVGTTIVESQKTAGSGSQSAPEKAPEPAASIAALPESHGPSAPVLAAGGGWERQLSERWMVWLGGVTLALGGAFLVKVSIDQGLLGPTVRVIFGCLLGIGVMALGHWLSYRQDRLSVPGVDPTYVPPALVGAGATMVFASLFAAYSLYDLLPSLVAFAGLALVAILAALLSLRHGPFVAGLGLVGALLVPALVSTDSPNALGLFGYLLLVTAPMMALLRWRGWSWLAWVELAGALLWVALWLVASFKQGDEWIVGGFLLLTFGIFIGLRRGFSFVPALGGVLEAPAIYKVVIVAASAVATGLVLMTLAADHSFASLTLVLAFSIGALAFSYRDQAFDALPLIVAILVAMALATWWLPSPILRPGDWVRPAMPDMAATYLYWAVCFAALFGITGFVLCRTAARPARWAALSAGAPIMITAIVYWRFSNAGIELGWVLAAMILAALMLAATIRMERLRAEFGMEPALGVYAVGVIAALALAATMGLKEAWLTVALSVILPGAGWVDRRIPIPGMRRTVLIVAGVVLARLVFNPYLLDYPIGDGDAFNWLLYGYGIPALAFAMAAYFFRRAAVDLTTQVLEASAILFAVMLVSLEIHHLMAGGLSVAQYGPAEQALHTISWLLFAAALSLSSLRDSEIVRWACRILLAISALQAIVSQAVIENPYITGVAVGETHIVNMLLLAFAFPSALFALHGYIAPKGSWLRRGCALLSLLLGLVWLTLEVRHSFSGTVLSGASVQPAELYAYSLAWLIVSGLLLAAGMILGSTDLRRTGMILLTVVVLKAFLFDMSSLDGIWRAFSFLGLGATLVAVGWFYRRYIGNEVR